MTEGSSQSGSGRFGVEHSHPPFRIPNSTFRVLEIRNPKSSIRNLMGPRGKVIMKDYHCQQLENRIAASASTKIGVGEICRYILVAGAMAALVITYSWVRSEIISLGYQIQELKHDTAVLREQRQALMLEQAACKSPQRIDQFAREQLGLIPANSAQVIFIRDREVLPEQRMLAESIMPRSITSKETRQ